MRIHYLQHVPFEGLGSMQPVLLAAGHTITVSRLYEAAALPTTEQFDWLIVMGGPMGVYDEREYPWLDTEKRLIENAIEDDKIVLGVCLGAQLIASVLGASVYANSHKEIGWFPVERTAAAAASGLGGTVPASVEAFHWHGDTFDLPAGALHLARSAACENQAFVYRQRILGLQFHLETTRESAEALIENCGHELVGGPYLQSAEAMLSGDERFTRINQVMKDLLERLAIAAV
ncbi:MAG: amidotransferase [Planctomycetia bacterium]|nr:amidotransferase [Planctomycetia bacterium]